MERGFGEQGLGIGAGANPQGWGTLTESPETGKAGVKATPGGPGELGGREGWRGAGGRWALRGDIRGARIQKGWDFSVWIPWDGETLVGTRNRKKCMREFRTQRQSSPLVL